LRCVQVKIVAISTIVAALAAFTTAVGAAFAQTPSRVDAAAIHGRVVADDTGQPLRNAHIALEADAGVEPVLADAEGRFTIAAPTGSRRLTVAKSGYAKADVMPADGVEIRLARGGVITGRVVDDRGSPAPFVGVTAEVLQRNGRVAPERAAIAETDDRGEYRLYGLAAGDYAVSAGGVRIATGGGIGGQPGAPIYYAGVPVLRQAQPVHVAAGDEVGGIDLTLRYIADRPRNASGLIVSSASVRAPTAPPASEPGPPGTVRGRVTGPDGLPLPRVRVALESSERLFSPDSVQADDDGWFAFHDVAPGGYLVSGEMPGYLRMVPGQRTPWERGDLVTMGPDRAEARVDLSLRRGDAIVGRVVDEYGDPVENVAMSVAAIRVVAGRPQLVAAPRAVSRVSGRTDDRGRYRIFGLAPGDYVVSASVGQRDVDRPTIDLPGYTRTYFPATLAANEAARVEVRDGEDRLNVDIALVKGGTARLAGRVIGANGEPTTATVSLAPSYRSGGVATGVRSAKADGVFEFTDLPPGEYVVQAAKTRVNPSMEGEFTARFVTITGVDVTDLVLPMSAGSTISGRIVFEDGDAPPASDAFELSPVAADPDDVSLASDPAARAEIRDDSSFSMGGVNGSRRLQVVRAPDGWMLKSILANGLDVTDQPLRFGTKEQSLSDVVVVMTNRVTGMSGAIADEKGAAFHDAGVVAFACDRELRYGRSRFVAVANASRDATFAMRGLPPADYYVAAVDRRAVADLTGEIENPEFLESLVAAAIRVTLGEGQAVSFTLRVRAR
jgi:carboxypeptidase family protein